MIWFFVAILGFIPPHFKPNEELKEVQGVVLELGRKSGSFSLRIASDDGEHFMRVDSPEADLAGTLKVGESIRAKLDGHYVVELAGEAGMLFSYEQYQARKSKDLATAVGGIVLCGGFIGWYGYVLYSRNRQKPTEIKAIR